MQVKCSKCGAELEVNVSVRNDKSYAIGVPDPSPAFPVCPERKGQPVEAPFRCGAFDQSITSELQKAGLV